MDIDAGCLKSKPIDYSSGNGNANVATSAGALIWKIEYDDGSVYCGEMQNFMAHGHGERLYPDGGKYVGAWRDGVPCGYGERLYPDGGVHAGHWRDGMAHGLGKRSYPEMCDEYDSVEHGLGKRVCEYDGSWNNGIVDGQGVQTLPDGSKYTGEWKNGHKHGRGEQTYPDGRKRVGDWMHGAEYGRCFEDECGAMPRRLLWLADEPV